MALRVLIAGAGIGGLTAALMLGSRGHVVTVLERAQELEPLGAGLVLMPNALSHFAGLASRRATQGILAELERRGEVLSSATLCSAGRIHLSGGPAVELNLSERIPTIAIHRKELHAVLLERALATGQVRLELGKSVIGFDEPPSAEGALVRALSDGNDQILGDMLLGADGLQSSVRAQLHPESSLRYAGYTCFRGVTPMHLDAAMSEAWGAGKRFGIVPIGRAGTYWFAVANAPEGQKVPQTEVLEVLQSDFAAFAAPVPAVIAMTPRDCILQHDIYDRPPLESWGERRVTLLGDAAHPMTPNLGQGASQAIEDAAFLSASLEGVCAGDVPAALRSYEGQRIGRTSALVRQSRRMGQLGQLSNPLLRFIRDTLLRATPTGVAHRHLRALLLAGSAEALPPLPPPPGES